jgi:hypothetical protein
MNDIDWSKAPADATHYQPENDHLRAAWIKIEGGKYKFRMMGQNSWATYDGPAIFMANLLPRPTIWTGEGLPPVGTSLEAGFACEEFATWHKGVCIAVGEDPEGREDFCVVQFGRKIAMYSAEGKRMRPIRTAEQIAADKRLHEIRNALTAIKAGQSSFPNDIARGNITIAVVEAMIDAGYRKQVQS